MNKAVRQLMRLIKHAAFCVASGILVTFAIAAVDWRMRVSRTCVLQSRWVDDSGVLWLSDKDLSCAYVFVPTTSFSGQETFGAGFAPRALPRWANKPALWGHPSTPCVDVCVLRGYGAPFRFAVATMILPNGHRESWRVSTGVIIDGSQGNILRGEWVVPLHIDPIQLIINVSAFSGIAAVAVLCYVAYGTTRRRYRLAHGLCVSCGYDLSSPGTVMLRCPECGRVGPRRARSREPRCIEVR
jgi:predicted RNA-binding Zn-ribbon protein involved in translation (DUF1610 family)